MIPKKYQWMRPGVEVNHRGINDKIGGFPFKFGNFWSVHLWKEKAVFCSEIKKGYDFSAIAPREESDRFQAMIKRRLKRMRSVGHAV